MAEYLLRLWHASIRSIIADFVRMLAIRSIIADFIRMLAVWSIIADFIRMLAIRSIMDDFIRMLAVWSIIADFIRKLAIRIIMDDFIGKRDCQFLEGKTVGPRQLPGTRKGLDWSVPTCLWELQHTRIWRIRFSRHLYLYATEQIKANIMLLLK